MKYNIGDIVEFNSYRKIRGIVTKTINLPDHDTFMPIAHVYVVFPDYMAFNGYLETSHAKLVFVRSAKTEAMCRHTAEAVNAFDKKNWTSEDVWRAAVNWHNYGQSFDPAQFIEKEYFKLYKEVKNARSA